MRRAGSPPIPVRRITAAALALAVAAALAAGCSKGTGAAGGDSRKGGGSTKGVDDGSKLTMWTRAATQTQSKELVKAYNASHKNQVELTVIPTDDYQAKVGTAAGSKNLPDLFAADVVFAPNYAASGLFADLTERIAKLPYADDLAPSHLKAGTIDGKKYVVPHTLDLSVLFYNKTLYRKAGLDPAKPPTTLGEWDRQARKVDKLGGGVDGTFFGGNCGGCGVFTWWPSIWAAGKQVMNAQGTAATLATPAAKQVYKVYRGWAKDGITAAGAKEETGATWTGRFPKGNIGVMPMPSTTLGLMPEKLDFGVTPIPGPDGGQSTFVGGDCVGIASNSKKADQAWDFLSWSLTGKAQVGILAKGGDVVARTDLANNKYAAADPRQVTINKLVAKGVTPYSAKFGQTYNDPNGPWLKLMRDAVFGEAGKVGEDNAAVTKSLAD